MSNNATNTKYAGAFDAARNLQKNDGPPKIDEDARKENTGVRPSSVTPIEKGTVDKHYNGGTHSIPRRTMQNGGQPV